VVLVETVTSAEPGVVEALLVLEGHLNSVVMVGQGHKQV
jgi:hypothetical protein